MEPNEDKLLLKILGQYLIDDIIKTIVFEYIPICNTEKLDRIITIKESCKPRGIAVSNKLIFISDIINHRIMVFDKSNDALLYTFGRHINTERGTELLINYEGYNRELLTLDGILFNSPTHMVVDNEILYVVDKFVHRIQMFKIHENNQLFFHGCFGKYDNKNNSMHEPCQILIVDNEIYVVYRHCKIDIYDKISCEFKKKSCDIMCYEINSISIDNTSIIISNKRNNEIQIYSLYEIQQKFLTLADCKKNIICRKQFHLPGYIMLVGNELLVIDRHKSQIQVLNKSSLEFIRFIKIYDQAILTYVTTYNNEIYIPTKTSGKKNEYNICIFKRFYDDKILN
jgi:hypothetical protein